MNSLLCVIPARYGSSRLPGKPLEIIHGKPMIYWVAKRIEASNIEEYIVATDDMKIQNCCDSLNIPCTITSPDCENGTERIAEVSLKISREFYINVQGDEPLISVDAINALADRCRSSDFDGFLQAVSPLSGDFVDDRSIVKVCVNGAGKVVYLSRAAVPFSRDGEPVEYLRCLGLYGYSRSFLSRYLGTEPGYLENIEKIEQLRCFESDIPMEAVSVEDEGFSIDTPQDLAVVKKLPIEKFLV